MDWRNIFLLYMHRTEVMCQRVWESKLQEYIHRTWRQAMQNQQANEFLSSHVMQNGTHQGPRWQSRANNTKTSFIEVSRHLQKAILKKNKNLPGWSHQVQLEHRDLHFLRDFPGLLIWHLELLQSSPIFIEFTHFIDVKVVGTLKGHLT